MQLRPDALAAHLSRTLAALYTISSDEPLLAQEAADRIRDAARNQGYSERVVLQVERSFKWGELQAAGQAQSLFGDKKLIELRLPGGKPGRDGSQALQSYAAAPAPDTVTLISLPKLDWAAQKSAWVTQLQHAGVFIDIPVVERSKLPHWIGMRLALQEQSAQPTALDFICERVEGNLLAAHQEVQKLALLYPAGQLSLAQVQDAVLDVARYDVFKLNEAMLAGDAARLARMLNGLKGEGQALPLVLWAMSDEIRTLLKLKAAGTQGQSLGPLLKQNRVFGAREALMPAALQRLTLDTLQRALHSAAQIDKMIKGLRAPEFGGDAWDALLQLGLRVASAA